MLLDQDFIKVNERPNLFENNFFDNEPVKAPLEETIEEEEINDSPPKIRVLTPVRKKEPDFKDIFSGESFKKIFPMPEIKNPTIDYSDEEEINDRVRKLITNSSNIDYTNEHEKVKEASKD